MPLTGREGPSRDPRENIEDFKFNKRVRNPKSFRRDVFEVLFPIADVFELFRAAATLTERANLANRSHLVAFLCDLPGAERQVSSSRGGGSRFHYHPHSQYWIGADSTWGTISPNFFALIRAVSCSTWWKELVPVV